MFEVGKDYMIKMHDGESQSSFNARLLSVDLPLIEVEHGASKVIINIGSSGFVSAERDDEELRAAKLAAHNHFIASLEGDQEAERRYDEIDEGSPKIGY